MNPEELEGRLAELARAVNASATDRELRDEGAILAAYRSAVGTGGGRARHLNLAPATAIAATASVVMLSMTAVTAAAYTSTLPPGAQRAAHQIFHRIGVPAPKASAEHPARSEASPAVEALDQRTAEAGSQDPTPSAQAGALLTIGLSGHTTPVGSPLKVTVTATLDGKPEDAGTPVGLLARTPGSRRWTTAGTARLDPSGTAVVTIARLEHNLELKWHLITKGQPALESQIARANARPVLSTRVAGTPVQAGLRPTLWVFSDPGQHNRKVALQFLDGGRWRDLAYSTFDAHGSAEFTLASQQRGRRSYRCLLAESQLYAPATTSPVIITVS